LNRNEANVWDEHSNGNGTQEALNIHLDDNGFLKLDTLAQKHLKNMKDPLVLAILDLILAMKAKEFTTCSSKCRSICSKWSKILDGPYRGLSQHESAIEVKTVTNEQFNDLDTLKRHGLLPKQYDARSS